MRNVRVEYANAVAGLTYGFPAVTQFLGFTHALSRKLEPLHAVTLHETAVIAHSVNVLASGAFEQSLHQTRNPYTKAGTPAPFNEEGKMHMTISLMIRVHGVIKGVDAGAAIVAESVKKLAGDMRLAGGRVCEIGNVRIIAEPEGKKLRGLMYSMLPGFVLTSAELEQEQPLTDFLNTAALRYTADEAGDWARVQGKPGYRVPLNVGFRAISPLYAAGTVEESRAQHNPFAFVEPVHVAGEWKSPHRVRDLNEILWRYETTEGYYLCRTAPAVAPTATDFDLTNLFNFDETE
ncbi:TPA: type I-F CRISPR-associated protein Csy2 [Enterobacter hormaechei subsp. xiangfangensis]|nr:type I-F CRISPR-associated protein Csy2 [Enterobacter hormaechei subsp. xiangfangensis]